MDIIGLIPQFGGFLWTILAFVIALSIIVAVHEYGHYIVGRWSGIKADVFSLGFGPVLFSRTDKHGTKWQFAALPFGGYVKFKGDADAASATSVKPRRPMSDAEIRQTMAGAPLWARAATVAAGPFFNFILSILIFAGVILTQGTVSDPLTIGKIQNIPVQHELREGDVVLAIEDQITPSMKETGMFDAFMEHLPIKPTLDYTVRRDGSEQVVDGPYPFPPIINQLAPQSAAYDIDLKRGDVILSVDGDPIIAFDELRVKVEGSDGKPLEIEVWRAGEVLSFVLAPRRVDEPQPDNSFVTHWRIGIAGGLFFEPATETPGIGTAVSGATLQLIDILEGSISGLYHMITGAISSCNLSGPIGIAQTSGAMASQGTTSFIWFIAVLSAAVGFLNLFPVPVLDGGHLVFFAFEALTGRQPSDRVRSVFVTFGLTLVLGLMAFALTNDIFCP